MSALFQGRIDVATTAVLAATMLWCAAVAYCAAFLVFPVDDDCWKARHRRGRNWLLIVSMAYMVLAPLTFVGVIAFIHMTR